MAHQERSQEMQNCIETCQNCHAVCLETIAHCLEAGGKHAEAKDRKSTRLNSSHSTLSRMPSSA